MRVLAANLEAALNSEKEPYLQLQYCIDGGFTWVDAPNPMYNYKLGNLELTLSTVAPHASFPWYAVRLKRGCYINHVATYETSSTYYVNNVFITQKTGVTIEASIIPKGTAQKYTVNGNQTYKQIIDAICTKFGYTATYETPASAIWSNIFYPVGRTLTLQSPHLIFTLLRQKLMIYALDDNDNEIYFRQWLDDQLVGTGGHPSLETITTFDWKEQYSLQYRQLTWLDETHTIHNYPNPAFYPDLPLYNLGYLEAAAATPTIWQSWHMNEDKRTFHLKYQDGDIIHCSSGIYQIQVTEIFNPKESPSLYLQFVALPKFSTTEGGPLPSNIEAAGNYIPLNVSNFTKNLSSSANNLQTFADAVDEMTTGPAMYAGAEKDPLVDDDEFAVIDSETTTHLVRKFTWSHLKTRLYAALGALVYVATAKDPPVDNDQIPLVDTETAGLLLKHFTWASLKSRVFAAFAISLAAATEITAPDDADLLPVSDVSLATDAIKRLTWANLKISLYEEETWTTTVTPGANFTGTPTLANGRYTKFGNIVILEGKFSGTVTTANLLTYFSFTLPFTPAFVTVGSAFASNNIRLGVSQVATSGNGYIFFPAASLLPSGAEVFYFSVSFRV